MISAPIPNNETERLEALKGFEILDTPSEQDYDDLIKLASAVCNTPISLISLIDSQRQWFKAKVGLDAAQTPRDIAFCAHAILQNELFVVPNAIEDERFFDNPLVTHEPNIRFYAGMPLMSTGGHKIGTLCIIDSEPRHLTDEQKFALKTLGKQVINMLELRVKNQRLAKLNSLQSKFLAIISHDVRNPLLTMRSLVEMVEREEISPEDFKDISGQLGSHVSTTIDLLNNLIDWGVAQARGDNFELKEIDAQELITKEVDRLLSAAKNKGIKLVNAIDANTTMLVDANMLKFIVRNLLTNAIKFTSEGSITISAEENESGWQLHVSDTGVGISDEKKPRMFNWEHRFTTNGTNDEGGSGLGLLMCKEFAEKHLGNITFQSQVNQGTIFTVDIKTKLFQS